MALLKPAWMQAVSGDADITYSAQQDRAAVLGAIFSREGVLDVDAGQLRVTQRAAGANYSVDIAAGRAAIQGDDVSDQGSYVVTSTATENRTIPNPPASGTRVHRVVARVKDKLHNGIWTGYEWNPEVLPDTGSGTPAVPASAIPLARVSVAAGQASVTNANIIDDRPRAAVGTPARVGGFTALNTNWGAVDAPRTPTWSVNPDGWVSLGGWLRYTGGNFTHPGGFGELYDSIPDAIRPPSGSAYRDVVAITSWGAAQLTARSVGGVNGWALSILFPAGLQLVQNSTWVSLEGCGWRL